MTANPSPAATAPTYAPAHRLEVLPPYPTALLEVLKKNEKDKVRDIIDQAAADQAKLSCFNYPNSPTAGVVDMAWMEEAAAFARRHNLLLVSDLAYSELAFDGFRPPSVLQAPGAKEVAVEFHSLSKTFNMDA